LSDTDKARLDHAKEIMHERIEMNKEKKW
jgi:hypothetical protein